MKDPLTFPQLLSLIGIGFGFVLFFVLILAPIPSANKEMANTILGIVGTGVVIAIFQFWLGSSDKSRPQSAPDITSTKFETTNPPTPAPKIVTADNWVVGDAVPDGYKISDTDPTKIVPILTT